MQEAKAEIIRLAPSGDNMTCNNCEKLENMVEKAKADKKISDHQAEVLRQQMICSDPECTRKIHKSYCRGHHNSFVNAMKITPQIDFDVPNNVNSIMNIRKVGNGAHRLVNIGFHDDVAVYLNKLSRLITNLRAKSLRGEDNRPISVVLDELLPIEIEESDERTVSVHDWRMLPSADSGRFSVDVAAIDEDEDIDEDDEDW